MGRRLAAGLLAVVLLGPAAAARAAAPLMLGVFPFVPTLQLERIFAPMAVELERATGRRVAIKTRPTFEAFAEQLDQAAYDIIFVHPFFYVDAHDFAGYAPLARVAGELRAVVLGRDDSPVRGMADLKGRVLALPPRLAGVSYMVAMELIALGLSPGEDVKVQHFRTKVSCLQAVALGDADGCAVPDFMLEQLPTIGRMSLRPLARTAPLPGLVFAAHGRLGPGERRTIAATLLAWAATEEGAAILQSTGWHGLVPAIDADYAMVREHATSLRRYAMH
jgi:phosphonate transport system substrate-binding protein